jgi:SAM-dependent methyltransferase
MVSRNFDWSAHISQLGELPPLMQVWEQELIGELQRWMPERERLRVLEIGCSNGRWLRWFKQTFGAQTFGVDLNAIGAGGIENFIMADGLGLPIKDGVFDVVFSMGLVEHFPDVGVRRKLISEHVRVARPHTGLVWLEHPNMNFSLNWLYIKYWYDHRQGYHHYRITDRETQRHFRNFGVEILSTRWIGWLPPRLVQLVTSKLHKHIPWLCKGPKEKIRRKRFEHSLTADNFLIIGRRR